MALSKVSDYSSENERPISTLTWSRTRNSRRATCERCQRPKPRACICESLPKESIVLAKSRILILQHPLERKRKNRSVPLLQLSLSSECIVVRVGRRLGEKTLSGIINIIREKNKPLLLLYPSPDAIPLEEALKSFETEEDEIVNILVLDATWKYAREMDRANIQNDLYPDNLIRVKLDPMEAKNLPIKFRPCRFEIRTPPSPDYLSTAECIAWAVSCIEKNASLYDVLLKPLDCMVTKWRSHSTELKKGEASKVQDESPPVR